jgi:hypothetical protein
MTPEDYLKLTSKILQEDGSRVWWDEIPSGPAVIGYQVQRRASWAFARIRLFTFVVSVQDMAATAVDRATSEAVAYARQAEAVPVGSGNGYGVLVVLVASSVPPNIKAIVNSEPVFVFGEIKMSAVVDLGTREVFRYSLSPFRGKPLRSWMKKRLALASPLPS